MSERNNVVRIKESCARSAAILAAFKRGFNEPLPEEIPEGQLSMMSQLFPIFDPCDEVQS
jgi:hypothetical protein